MVVVVWCVCVCVCVCVSVCVRQCTRAHVRALYASLELSEMGMGRYFCVRDLHVKGQLIKCNRPTGHPFTHSTHFPRDPAPNSIHA